MRHLFALCQRRIAVRSGSPLYREGQRIAFKLGAFGIYCLQRRIKLTDLRLIDRGVGDAGAVDGDRAIAGDHAINGRQRRGFVPVERGVPVMRVLIIMVNDSRLTPLVNRVTAVVHAAAAVLRQIAVGGNDAGVIEQPSRDAQHHIAARQNARTDALGDQPVARQRAAFGTLAEVVVIGDEWRAVDVDMLFGIPGHHLRPVVFPMEAVLVRRWDSRQLVSPPRFVERHRIAAVGIRLERQVVDPQVGQLALVVLDPHLRALARRIDGQQGAVAIGLRRRVILEGQLLGGWRHGAFIGVDL